MIGIFRGRGIGDDKIFAKIDVAFRKEIHNFKDKNSMTSLGVFLCLALHADEGGWTTLTRPTLKKEIGINSEAAITAALKHLRGVRIGGHRIFAHYRQVLDGNKWGQSAYLIFPDLDHPDPPYDNMIEYATDENETATDRTPINGTPTSGTPATNIKENQLKKNQDSAPAKPERAVSGKRQMLGALEEFFSDVTYLPMPKRATEKEKRAGASLWWTPLRNMLEAAEWDMPFTRAIINTVIAEMRKDNLTISSPNSILNPYNAKLAEIKAQRAERSSQRRYAKTHV